MIAGPILVFGGLIALFTVLGAPVTNATGWVAVVAAVAFLLWRVSLVFGPNKKCYRCGGDGWRGGVLGGRRECSSCTGKGYRPRVGSGGQE